MTNHYIRQGATGNNTGTDWTNAWTALPAALFRGDTYYIADGNYGSYTFDDATSGSAYIYIKKATIVDHGIETGWSDSYGDGQTTFTAWTIITGYWDINGQVGRLASDMPNYVPYGFVVSQNGGNQSKIISIGASGSGNNVNISHTEAYFTNTTTWATNMDVIYGNGPYWNFDYVWLHDGGRVLIYMISTNNLTVSNSVIEKNGRGQFEMNWSPTEHSELMPLRGSNGVLNYNIFRDWRSTGGVMFMGWNSDESGCHYWDVYGNVFVQTGYYPNVGNANGSIAHDSSGHYSSHLYLYNNTVPNGIYPDIGAYEYYCPPISIIFNII